MRKHGKHRKYSDKDILVEANKYLESGMTIITVALALSVPASTLDWHLRVRLKSINHAMWERVYNKSLMHPGRRRQYK